MSSGAMSSLRDTGEIEDLGKAGVEVGVFQQPVLVPDHVFARQHAAARGHHHTDALCR